jgi:hypothetical protein
MSSIFRATQGPAKPRLILKPASAVRRRTMRQASTRFIGLFVSAPVLPAAEPG